MADFYTDHDVTRLAAALLRTAGHGVVTARELILERATDDEQLLTAAQRDRILITHNERDFILLHDAWQRWGSAWQVRVEHPGILILPQGRKYNLDWDASQITREVIRCLAECGPLTNNLFRRRQGGWERRAERGWIACL